MTIMSQPLTVDSLTDAKFDFFTVPQFNALSRHFESFIESINEEGVPEWVRIKVEFSRLLEAFQACFRESEQKTRKIHELTALNAIAEARKVRSGSLAQDTTTVQELRNAISKLQRDLDFVDVQKRELLDDIDFLKAAVGKQNGIIQSSEKSLISKPAKTREDGSDVGPPDSELNKDSDDIKPEAGPPVALDERSSGTSSPESENNAEDVIDAKVLKNDLAILVLELKSARGTVQELKKEIHEKDNLARELNEDVCRSKRMLAEAETEKSEIRKPLEMKIAEYEAELDAKRQKIEDISNELEEKELQNAKLRKDTLMKDSVIQNLMANLKVLENKKSSACRRAEAFEGSLAESQNTIESLKDEIDAFVRELEILKKYVPPSEPDKDRVLEPGREAKAEVNAQQRTIDSLKSRITVLDQKMRRLEEEMSATANALQGSRQELISANKERVFLHGEVSSTKKSLKEKASEARRLKETLKEERQELDETKKELNRRIKRHQQAVDKRDALHSKYDHLKLVNGQQKRDNALLMKRQEYLAKILKEKDMEIERVVTWKRYIC